MTYQLRDGIEFLKSLPDKSVDGLFTDPPWGIRVSESATGYRRPDSIIQGQSNWLELIKAMTDEAARVLKSDGRCLIWLGMRHVGPVCKIVDALEYRWMIFVYYIPSRYVASLESCLDPIIYFALPGSRWPSKRANGKSKGQMFFKASTGRSDTDHPCARPIQSVREILRDWFEEGEYVVDPMGGSNTTGVACEQLGIKSDVCEIDSAMYQTGLDRMAQGGFWETFYDIH